MAGAALRARHRPGWSAGWCWRQCRAAGGASRP